MFLLLFSSFLINLSAISGDNFIGHVATSDIFDGIDDDVEINKAIKAVTDYNYNSGAGANGAPGQVTVYVFDGA